MKFLNHLQFNENEAKNMKMFRVANPTTTYTNAGVSGNIIMDTTTAGAHIPKWWDGGNWRDFSYGTTGTMNWNIQSDSGNNIQVDQGDILDLTGGTGISTVTTGQAPGSAPIVTFNLQPATTSALGGVIAGANVSISNGTISVPNNTNTTYTGDVSTGITLTNTEFTVNSWGQVTLATNGSNAASETSSRYYRVGTDTAGKLIVNVPWANTNTQRLAGVGLTLNSNTIDANTWGVNSSANAAADTDETNTKWYGVHTDSNDKLVVRVPWQDTNLNSQNQYAISAADGSNNGREKIVLSGSGHNGTTTDFVEIGAGTGLSIARVSDVITLTNTVSNTNTTYSAGSNITLSAGNAFSVPVLTNTTLGVARTAHAALNNTAVSSVGETATGRVYGIQKNTNNQLVVQVPWANTNTNTQATYTLPVAAGAGNTAIINLTGGGAASGVASAVTFSGTANEVAITESVGNNGSITIGLPDDVTIGNDLTVTNDALVSGDVTVTGNLTVNGTTTTLNTEILEVEDNFIEINKVVSGASSANTADFGVTGERGSSSNVSLKWIESKDTWWLDESNTNENAGGLVSKKIIQEIWRNVDTDSGTASHTQYTTNNTLNILGANGITTSATGQTVTVNGGTGMTPSKVVTIASSSINSSTNKKATLTHSLGTKDIVVRLYEMNGDDYDEIYADVSATTTSACTVQFSANLSNNVRAVIIAASNAGAATVAYS